METNLSQREVLKPRSQNAGSQVATHQGEELEAEFLLGGSVHPRKTDQEMLMHGGEASPRERLGPLGLVLQSHPHAELLSRCYCPDLK